MVLRDILPQPMPPADAPAAPAVLVLSAEDLRALGLAPGLTPAVEVLDQEGCALTAPGDPAEPCCAECAAAAAAPSMFAGAAARVCKTGSCRSF